MIERPPLGLMPEWCWVEQRMQAIDEAIERYVAGGEIIPVEWVEEYLKHSKYIQNREENKNMSKLYSYHVLEAALQGINAALIRVDGEIKAYKLLLEDLREFDQLGTKLEINVICTTYSRNHDSGSLKDLSYIITGGCERRIEELEQHKTSLEEAYTRLKKHGVMIPEDEVHK